MQRNFRDDCLSSLKVPFPKGRCFIVAEVAQSHDGSLGMAHSFIDAIANAGADAVKFQTHIAAEESTPNEPWRVKFSKQDATRYKYWQRMEFSKAQWLGLKEHADERGLLFMSSPFSEAAVDLLAEIGMKVWKIPSGEIGSLQLLNKIAATGDPIIMSSGMSDWDELDAAVELGKRGGNRLAVLQCTTAYPCPPESIGLNMLDVLRKRYDVPVGLSDHSGNIFASLAAATLGAEVLEIHVALSREMFGPDVKASVTTTELAQMVEGCRHIERMLDSPVDKSEMAGEMSTLRSMFTKSIVAGTDLSAGTILAPEHLKLKKPGNGLPAGRLQEILGKTLLHDVHVDDLVLLGDIAS
ncbi:MAG: N-acetylneuraminate synthase family protein [Pyrinomonadaceae bacterium]